MNRFEVVGWANREADREIEAAGRPFRVVGCGVIPESHYDPIEIWGMTMDELREAQAVCERLKAKTPWWRFAERRELGRQATMWHARHAHAGGCEIVLR